MLKFFLVHSFVFSLRMMIVSCNSFLDSYSICCFGSGRQFVQSSVEILLDDVRAIFLASDIAQVWMSYGYANEQKCFLIQKSLRIPNRNKLVDFYYKKKGTKIE